GLRHARPRARPRAEGGRRPRGAPRALQPRGIWRACRLPRARSRMIHLAAPTVLRIAPDELAPRARERFGGELRRAGTFAQLSLLGAQACLDAAPKSTSLGVLWGSAHGAVGAARDALAQAASGEPV